MLKKNPHNIMAAIAAAVITGCSQIPRVLCGWPSFVRKKYHYGYISKDLSVNSKNDSEKSTITLQIGAYIEMKKLEECYTNRELSWLQFNERVLNEAGNPRVPLAERLTFASIYQTNLDEFFMVRVGTLMMQMNSKEKIRENKTKMTSEEQVAAILDRVCTLEKKKAKIYEQLMGELEPKGIRIINFNKLSKDEGDFLEKYFDAHIAPFLSPMIIGKQQPFPFLANKQLYAIVLLTSQKGKKKQESYHARTVCSNDL